jgi:hypothetical protein
MREEAYLEANPGARMARALVTMVSEGDVEGILDLLETAEQGQEEDGEPGMSTTELLTYQDPLDCLKSHLHVAIEQQQEDVFWLLLWLASDLLAEQFPPPVLSTASRMGVERPTGGHFDIRTLRDENGDTPLDIAIRMGGPWDSVVHAGILHRAG